MNMPSHEELIEHSFVAIRELGGSASINEIVGTVINNMQLSQELVDRAHGEGNRTELEYRLAWARTYLKKYGVVNNSERGVWSLTTEGTRQDRVDPREVVQFVQQQARNSKVLEQIATDSTANVPENFDELLEDETTTWRDELLNIMRTMPPDAFERLCQRMLRESGFIEVEVTGRSGDGGIDGHGTIRVGGLISFNVLFQSKRHRGSISASVVRDFRGAMIGRADKGLVISTGSFTRDAQKEATRDGAPPIDLIDGELLVDKLKELRLGVKIEQIEVVQVDTGWFDNI